MGDLIDFVEEAVRGRMLDVSIETIRQDNDDLPNSQLETLIEEAVRAFRAEHFTRK